MSNISPPTDRVQTGVRLEQRLVKVLKALAALQDMAFGDPLESLLHRAFAGIPPLEKPVLAQVHELMRIYGLAPDQRRLTAIQKTECRARSQTCSRTLNASHILPQLATRLPWIPN